jgi:hypothetical protein
LETGDLKKYAFYAVGEIFLVVIGILIALQINNWSTENKTRKKELVYLENIKQDLKLNLDALNEFITVRSETARSADWLLDHFEGKPIDDMDKFVYHNFNVMIWFPFIQHSNTYNELVNSGNFAIISNKEIKNELQDMQTSFSTIAFVEGEMQQDYERYLYDVFFNLVDLNTSFKNFDNQMAGGPVDPDLELDRKEADALLRSNLYKSGLVLAKYNSNLLVEEYQNMIDRTNTLIEHIDIEIE